MTHAEDGQSALRPSAAASLAALLTAGGTLVCCVLPAAMAALGAGASLAGLVSAVPQLIWLPAHKSWVFGVATVALIGSGVLLHRARLGPCPADPALARTCARLRRLSQLSWLLAVSATALGAVFAFVLPWWMARFRDTFEDSRQRPVDPIGAVQHPPPMFPPPPSRRGPLALST